MIKSRINVSKPPKVLMRVITLYGLELVPPELAVPDEIKHCVSRLLKEVLKLSQTIS